MPTKPGYAGKGQAGYYGLYGNLEGNLIELQNEFIWKTYKVGRYRMFYVYEPKRRLIMALQFKDRVAQHAIYRQLTRYWTSSLFMTVTLAGMERGRTKRLRVCNIGSGR